MLGPIYATPVQSCDAETVPWAKPIRIYQFVLVSVLFALTSQTISKDSPYGHAEAAAIAALYGTFLLITLVDIISQCSGDPIPDTPMFLFGVLGAILFLVAAADMFLTSRKEGLIGVWRLTVAIVISIVSAVLFLLDVVLIFLYGY